jgi:hypothetical protein
MVLLVPVSAQSTTEETPIEFGHEQTEFVLFAENGVNITFSEDWLDLMDGSPVVYYGDVFNDLIFLRFSLMGETDNSTKVVVNGVILQESQEYSLVIKDYSPQPNHNATIDRWIEDVRSQELTSYDVMAIRTEIEYHEPYGTLDTTTELVKVNDTSSEFDWYDVTVSQTLTPGANTSGSDWEWGWLTYTMNGSKGDSNVFLSDYDAPPSNELPTGLFSFLWRILNFHPRDFFPWFYQNELDVEGIDMSDFSLEKFSVRYQAPLGYQKADAPLEMRHHYVLRVGEGVKPRFWQETQVKYVRAGTLAAPPYYSPLLHEGYLELR